MALKLRGRAHALLILALFFLCLSWVIVATRLFARLRFSCTGLDDYLMLCALVSPTL